MRTIYCEHVNDSRSWTDRNFVETRTRGGSPPWAGLNPAGAFSEFFFASKALLSLRSHSDLAHFSQSHSIEMRHLRPNVLLSCNSVSLEIGLGMERQETKRPS